MAQTFISQDLIDEFSQIRSQTQYQIWLEKVAADVAEEMIERAHNVDSEEFPFNGYGHGDIGEFAFEELYPCDRDQMVGVAWEYSDRMINSKKGTPLQVQAEHAIIDDLKVEIVYELGEEYLGPRVAGDIDGADEVLGHPAPYLWLGHDEELDEPIWYLPLESEVDSKVWEDDDHEIEIVWWDR